MPLYNYQCDACKDVIEKFLHIGQKPDITCKCGSKNLTKLFNKTSSRTSLNAKDMLHKRILPDADRIKNDIGKGKDKDFLDIYGEK